MNRNTFSANSWLHDNSSASGPLASSIAVKSYSDEGIASDTRLIEEESTFSPSNFLIPGWKGESIISKPALFMKKIQEQLWKDAITQFKKGPSFNKSLKISVHSEFMNYANHFGLAFKEIDNYMDFWHHLYLEDSPFRKELDDYIDIYCFRTVTIYLYKIKFIIAMATEAYVTVSENNLLNPNSFFTKIFKRGSSRELVCESLQSNLYSWYQPSKDLICDVNNFSDNFKKVSVTEIMKMSSFSNSCRQNPDLGCAEEDYSHSLSHKSFGLFINSLLVFLPIWKNNDKFKYPQPLQNDFPQVVNTKFIGNYLTSMSHSHWLAQEHNCYLKWSEVLCPDFTNDSFNNGQYTKFCHELQFLNFLVFYSKKNISNPIDFIATTIKEKYRRSRDESNGQPSLFSRYELKTDLVYDRVVLNLLDLPKKNPHHFLISNINAHKDSLEKNGQLVVLANQKLFVPSQSARIEQLLQDFNLEVHFNFEDLKGKGEIPNYIYIFTKKESTEENDGFFFDPFGHPIRKAVADSSSFSTFRWTGELSLFGKFDSFVDELNKFFKEKNSSSTPLYQNDLGDGLCFEFHQDAILEGGILLSSTSKDSSRITHPVFFKNLTKACSPFDHFFSIEQIDSDSTIEAKKSITTDLLGISLKKNEMYPLVLIVDYTNTNEIVLELTTAESYKAKAETYGQAYYQYYGLIPKIPGLNINLFREYFSTNIGRQIIQLSLQGGFTKLKSKLKSLLVPNFFGQSTDMPHYVQTSSNLFKLKDEDLLKLHPKVLEEEWSKYKSLLSNSSRDYPWAIMSVLSNFKFYLQKAHAKVSSKNSKGFENINYNNPLIIEPLIRLKNKPIYPKHDEVYVDFTIETKDEIHQELQSIAIKTDDDGSYLELCGNDNMPVARIYSELEMLGFAQFILSNSIGEPISMLLSNLNLPVLEELREVLSNFTMMDQSLLRLKTESIGLIDQILTKQISQPIR